MRTRSAQSRSREERSRRAPGTGARPAPSGLAATPRLARQECLLADIFGTALGAPAAVTQRTSGPGLEEEEPLQGRFEASRDAPGAAAPPPALARAMARVTGEPVDDVRVRYDSPEPARLGALAFAREREVHLGPRQERHLPHELAHTVQQRQGRVRPTTAVVGVPVNDDPALETEADRVGARAQALARDLEDP